MANSEQDFSTCFRSWIVQQEEDLENLVQGLKEDAHDNQKLLSLVEISIKHYADYHRARLAYAPSGALSLFTPKWCTTFENSYMWVAGCRPAMYIRLIYTLCGSNVELHLEEFLQGTRIGNLGELSAEQLNLVDNLQRRTIKHEDELSSKVASMQEEMADKVLVQVSNSYGKGSHDCNRDAFGHLDSFELGWVDILKKADELRLDTLKRLVKIMTPVQAVEFLIAAKKLHLTMHRCCHERDDYHQQAVMLKAAYA